MAHPVKSLEDYPGPDLSAALVPELSEQLDQLLLTASTIPLLFQRLGELLLDVLKVDGVWLGAPDEHGEVHAPFCAGPGVQEFLAGGRIHLIENADSPLAQAWSTGVPKFAFNWTDAENPLPNPFWHQRGLDFGWRSSCAVPTTGTQGTRDILILYSKHVDFFAQEQVRQFVQQLHSMLGFALERLRLLEAALKNQQTILLYKNAMDVSVHGIVIAEAIADLPICYVNPAFERITGYSAAEAIGHNCRFLQGPDTAQPQLEIIRNALREGKPCTVELRNYRKDGTMFWNAVSIAPVLNAEGRVTHFIGIEKDITDLKNVLSESVHTNALYRALMGAAELVIDAQGEDQMLQELCHLLVKNELFTVAWIGRPNVVGDLEIKSIYSTTVLAPPVTPNLFTGDATESMTVRTWRSGQLQFMNDRLTGPAPPAIRQFIEKHNFHAVAMVPIYRNGDIWSLLTLTSREANIFTPELLQLIQRIAHLVGHGLEALDLRHILEEERTYQSWLARHDPLTDLLNRRGLLECLEEASSRAIQQKQSMAVALIDLDGFRVMNELHGHPACDLLLRTVAERLRSTLKPGDEAGRLGGDEFVLILENLAEEDLADTLARVQDAVAAPMHLTSGRTATMQVSIGVTLFPQDNSTPEHLLRHADRAIYSLKESTEKHASRWMLFRPEAHEQKKTRQRAILALFRKGNLRVHYQPVVNIQTGTVIGVESLARLVDDENALLLPAGFLPQLGAEELTLLTSQVLSRGIQDMQRLQQAGFRLNMGINLEPVTLADPRATEDLRRQIESSKLGPNYITLELLEHADTLSIGAVRSALDQLKASGARIALDDVGSAYSSLLRIKELPVDSMKLDRSFLVGLEQNPKELRFLMHIVDLAQALGVDLIAEGIESDACRDALAALGFQYAQGYAIAMPMTIDDLEQWLLRYKPVPWTGPSTLLGAVAVQLHDLFVTESILVQRPSLLEHLVSLDPICFCEIGGWIQTIGPAASQLLSAHRAWHCSVASLRAQSVGSIDPAAFQAIRAEYEEEMFRAVLDGSPAKL